MPRTSITHEGRQTSRTGPRRDAFKAGKMRNAGLVHFSRGLSPLAFSDCLQEANAIHQAGRAYHRHSPESPPDKPTTLDTDFFVVLRPNLRYRDNEHYPACESGVPGCDGPAAVQSRLQRRRRHSIWPGTPQTLRLFPMPGHRFYTRRDEKTDSPYSRRGIQDAPSPILGFPGKLPMY